MDWSITIGVLVIIVLILIRFGLGDTSTILARFQKSTGESGSSQKSSWLKPLIWVVGIGIIITILTGKNISGISGTTKTLELEVSSLQPHQLCGIPPGERKFSVPNKSFVMIDGDDYEINTYVRVNGSLPNESFTVDSSGCATVSFAFTKKALGRTINPQILQIALK